MFQILLPRGFSFYAWMFQIYNRNIETLSWFSESMFRMSRNLVGKSLLLVYLQNIDMLGKVNVLMMQDLFH